MGYDRNDRRFGMSDDRQGYGGGAPDRGRYGYGRPDQDRYRDDDRARSYGDHGYGRQDQHRAEWRDRDRDGQDDRGFFDRAGDEVRSWFGDEEAERRRRQDESQAERDYRQRFGADQRGGYAGYQGGSGYGRGSNSTGRAGAAPGYDPGRHDEQSSGHDQGYRSWRDRQMQDFDRDYDEYRREHQSRFDSEFRTWREQRQGQRALLGKVQEKQEVVGSDGTHVGTVDHVRGDRILLTKSDQAAGGHHHSIPCSWIQSVEDRIVVSKTAEQAQQHWRDEEKSDRDAFGWRNDDDRPAMNRSGQFSGNR